jgi:poly(3-hydroxybutyrate) depolymerase
MRLSFWLCVAALACALTSPASAQQAADRVALVIGNANYPDASTPLTSTSRDVRTVAAELRRLGFGVDLKENVTRQEMQAAIDAFMGKIGSGTAALFYFSGYGIQVARQTYLIPLNAQIWTEADVRRDGIGIDTVLAEMHRRGAKTKIVILDAGRRNPFERRFRQAAEGLAPLDAPESTLAMYSVALGRVMSDATAAGNSAFVNELMKEVRVPNVTAEEVFNRVRVGVSRATNNEQIPWVASSLVQDFYFGTPPVATPQPAPAPSVARPRPAPPPAPTPAPAATTAAGSMQITVDGRARTFLLARPSEQGPRPTIIVLHGLNGTGAEIAGRTGLDQSAPRAGFVGVFPDGLRNRWNPFPPGKEPASFAENSREVGGVPDDVAFLKALVADLVRRGISDPKRIYLAGLSNGGFMTLRMICADAGLMAAAALLVTGMLDPVGADCRPAKPVPVLMVSGTADQTIPFAGGPVQPSVAGLNVWSAERLTAFLRERNGCSESADVSDLPNAGRNRLVLFRWTRCSGAPVESYRVMGGNHGSAWALNNLGQVLLDFFRDKVRDDAVAAANTSTPSGAPARPRPQPPPAADAPEQLGFAARPQQRPPAANAPEQLGFAARPNQRPVAAGALNSIAYRRYEGTNLITGAMTRTAGDEWVETNSRGSKWSFRATLETSAEVTLYDASRDVHVKLDLIGKKMLVRRGTAPWSPLADIVGIEK